MGQQPTQQNDATRCQKCAYKKGLCAICGVMVLDTSRESAVQDMRETTKLITNPGYKQSVK